MNAKHWIIIWAWSHRCASKNWLLLVSGCVGSNHPTKFMEHLVRCLNELALSVSLQ